MEEIINTCIEAILPKLSKPTLVAVTGESGSGKSHFIKALKASLNERHINFTYLNHDDFLIPRHEREALRNKIYKEGTFKGKTYWEILENWYYLDEFKEVLHKLRNNEPATYRPYVHATGDISKESVTLQPNKLVILENKLFLDEMDMVIELAVDRQTIIKRKIDRDSDVRTPEQTVEMHEKAQGYFWDRCKPQSPDIVIDNTDFNRPILLKPIASALSQRAPKPKSK